MKTVPFSMYPSPPWPVAMVFVQGLASENTSYI